MDYLESEALDPASREFATQIFHEFPEWRRFAREEPYAGGPSTYVRVEVPNPNPWPGCETLLLVTDNEEITIFFNDGHWHYDSWETIRAVWELLAAAPYLRALFADEIAFASLFEGGQMIEKQTLRAGEMLDGTTLAPGESLRIRSWNATRNADFSA